MHVHINCVLCAVCVVSLCVLCVLCAVCIVCHCVLCVLCAVCVVCHSVCVVCMYMHIMCNTLKLIDIKSFSYFIHSFYMSTIMVFITVQKAVLIKLHVILIE